MSEYIDLDNKTRPATLHITALDVEKFASDFIKQNNIIPNKKETKHNLTMRIQLAAGGLGSDIHAHIERKLLTRLVFCYRYLGFPNTDFFYFI